MTAIKASVCVVTYNQKNYLRDCLTSLLEQEVDFEYEIIIGDDASTDGTADIVSEFFRNYPQRIVSIRHEKNVGPTANYVSVHSQARGEFVFHMDGDDIAFPNKLKRQVEFLENSDCVLAWHKVQVFNDAGEISRILHENLSQIVDINAITQKDLLRYGMLGAHSSTAYKKSAMPNFRELKGEALDYFLVCLILASGNAGRVEEILGGYRVNAAATTASKKGSLYFKGSPIRELYAEHLSYFLKSKNQNTVKQDIFLNAFFNFLVDVRFFRPSSITFFSLAIRAFSLKAALKIPSYLRSSLELRK
ncbi:MULTISPECIES: glycosyltransferase [unclassified Pseudomonas]|uniref:glycosyltransferase n=1 Tax=unclassified Pseudomonas TaxID=196821 RepID=UPI0009F31601|nr:MULTISPECIES: glycosyltransferase [unclassified Pseudomonas]QIH09987.1 glycosyltransferase [Pseudomonas sp. BIOMIG1BAC]